MSLPFGPPVPVSPLIRGARFALLIAGIMYGLSKQKVYDAKEAVWREEEAERKIIRDRELVKLRAKIDREEKESVRLFETGEMFK